ncbi:Glycosyltransferase involved in cell wall bisynthesis [Cyclonatronum proteinivorum]|uniref:Glycosyltransferase involved in cell wall bisynthesis n=1 Tax=Cyclonatronum proteinivorum TaxID=1457365 RepID=A0A345UGY5_9BACT|nr:glycosyltransferase family 4 protein [Cyclonatronum proteinivorum]AXI99736.1 Glycosyltransferase involved in cell wall bisynthesis [Cyclonatronum proteinivorum]
MNTASVTAQTATVPCHIFHINTYYYSNQIHQTIVKLLDKKGYRQTILAPISERTGPRKGMSDAKLRQAHIHNPRAFRYLERYLWPLKTRKIQRMFEALQAERGRPDLVCAHTLISNGVVAWLNWRKTGTPYVVAVRSSDVKTFLKPSGLFRRLAMAIIRDSAGLYTMSPAYEKSVRTLFPETFHPIYNQKIQVIPNGADDFWFENRHLSAPPDSSRVELLFVGQLDDNKNAEGVLKAAAQLVSAGTEVRVTIVGDGPRSAQLAEHAYPFEVRFEGFVSDTETLLSYYRNAHVLVVPSHIETFGVAYVEAMSQGVPVVYTRNQGFDGFFPDGTYGHAVSANDPGEMASAILKIMDNYAHYAQNAYEHAPHFGWKSSIDKFEALFREAVR